jgi:hypothetical protein
MEPLNNNNIIEENEQENIKDTEKINDINIAFEKWKYEKILLDNNIIDYNCKKIYYFYYK